MFSVSLDVLIVFEVFLFSRFFLVGLVVFQLVFAFLADYLLFDF